ncbi:MAG: hypothetical protein ACKPKO_44225 [Candidatus Fonsibacter sp.]
MTFKRTKEWKVEARTYEDKIDAKDLTEYLNKASAEGWEHYETSFKSVVIDEDGTVRFDILITHARKKDTKDTHETTVDSYPS